jgi:hypothetical protein
LTDRRREAAAAGGREEAYVENRAEDEDERAAEEKAEEAENGDEEESAEGKKARRLSWRDRARAFARRRWAVQVGPGWESQRRAAVERERSFVAIARL